MQFYNRFYYFALIEGGGVKYCDQCVCMSIFVCLFVCLLACLFTTFSVAYMVPEAVAWSFSDGNTIRYVLPILWMTPCLHNHDGTNSSPGGGTSRTSQNVWSSSPYLAAPGAKSAVSSSVLFSHVCMF